MLRLGAVPVRARRRRPDFPLSREVAILRSYASGSGPFISIQWATSDPSASARTEGTSAKFEMRCSLSSTTVGCDHPAGMRSANFRAAFMPLRSSQLRRVLPPPTVICGAATSPCDGALRVSMVKAGRAACCAAETLWTGATPISSPAHALLPRNFASFQRPHASRTRRRPRQGGRGGWRRPQTNTVTRRHGAARLHAAFLAPRCVAVARQPLRVLRTRAPCFVISGRSVCSTC